ncbi:MAG: hypothetical protein EZS28_046099, partial [Streblomastix strix]
MQLKVKSNYFQEKELWQNQPTPYELITTSFGPDSIAEVARIEFPLKLQRLNPKTI